MDEIALLEQLTKMLLPDMAIIVAVLIVIGYLLKRTPKVQDWLIVWVLLFLGIAFSVLTVGPSVHAALQGILAAGVAVLTHQLWKQTKGR